ncbi:MAG TPA: hypothetical protein VEL47_08345 [Myxococcota bacterium]|nr:hypothetical protein [Myxococcota bacterium]
MKMKTLVKLLSMTGLIISIEGAFAADAPEISWTKEVLIAQMLKKLVPETFKEETEYFRGALEAYDFSELASAKSLMRDATDFSSKIDANEFEPREYIINTNDVMFRQLAERREREELYSYMPFLREAGDTNVSRETSRRVRWAKAILDKPATHDAGVSCWVLINKIIELVPHDFDDELMRHMKLWLAGREETKRIELVTARVEKVFNYLEFSKYVMVAGSNRVAFFNKLDSYSNEKFERMRRIAPVIFEKNSAIGGSMTAANLIWEIICRIKPDQQASFLERVKPRLAGLSFEERIKLIKTELELPKS